MRALLPFLIVSCVAANISPNTGQNRVVDSRYYKETDVTKRYDPDWSDLDTRPLPEWYDKAKIGIFIHWGVFSVPSFHSEWMWAYFNDPQFPDVDRFMKNNYPPGYTYQEFAPQFTAEFFDAKEWAGLFARAGAKYVVLTSKHHEGFTLFPSRRSFSWNSVEVGPHRDIVGELNQAVKSFELDFGVYHSLYEWHNPIYLEDKNNNFTTFKYRDTKLWPDIKQLINDYRPSVLWCDGDWEADDTYWNSTLLVAWLYNDSPVKDRIVVNDRWGRGTNCHHGDFYNCKDRYNPGTLQNHKWENAFTLDKKSWGYRRNMDMESMMTIEELLFNVVSTVSCGGNALINIGPTKEGTIPLIFQERLLQLGAWLNITGEAIYETSPWKHQNDSSNSHVWYTCKIKKVQVTPQRSDTMTTVYAIILKWPQDDILEMKDVTAILHSGTYNIQMLGLDSSVLKWKINNGVAKVQLPDNPTIQKQPAWALKFIPHSFDVKNVTKD